MNYLKAKLLSAVAFLALAPSAFAASHHPTGEYAQFSECPLSQVTTTDCIYSVSRGGEFKVGNKAVPLVNPVTLQGGFEGSGEQIKFFGAENGETLSKTPQPVPGGLQGVAAPSSWPVFLQEWFDEQLEEGATNVTSTVELTGPSKGLTKVKLSTENLLLKEGTALGLPVRFRLSNAILGSNCHIGSEKSPIQLHLTTGRSGDLTGSAAGESFNPNFTITTIGKGRFVDNIYGAPTASGCGGLLSAFIDPLVDSVIELPGASGENTAVMEGKFQDAVAAEVRASE